jgi:hypothetical protein
MALLLAEQGYAVKERGVLMAKSKGGHESFLVHNFSAGLTEDGAGVGGRAKQRG